MDNIVKSFLSFKIQIKLYHWKTTSYARHKATDEFLISFDEKVDKFVEAMIGGRDIKPTDKFRMDLVSLTEKSVVDYINSFKQFMVFELPALLFEHETDLFNLKDEILSDLNTMLYLFKLK
jgi:hypothetical protein